MGEKTLIKEMVLDILSSGVKPMPDLVAAVQAKFGDVKTRSIRRRTYDLCAQDKIILTPAGFKINDNITAAVKKDKQVAALKEQLEDVNVKYKHVLRDETFQDRILEMLGHTVSAYKPVIPPGPEVRKNGITRESVVALLSDWHIPEVVLSADTGGLGEYNIDIAKEYLENLADTTISICKNKLQGYSFQKIYVFMLGDIVSQNIHDLLETTPDTVVDGFFASVILFSQYLIDMARTFPEVEVRGVPGNHGRLQEQKKYRKRYANWDYLFYNTLALTLRDQPNIHFDFTKSFWQIEDVEGWKFLLLHGDDIQSWNQIPWYGISRAFAKFKELLNAHQLDYDYGILAHFHNSGDIDRTRGEWFINGSAIGATDFSIGKLFTGNLPKQYIFGVHPEKGISWRFPLMLERKQNCRYVFNNGQQPREQFDLIERGLKC